MVVKFVDDWFKLNVVYWDEEKIFFVDVMCEVVELGFVGIYMCEDVGGFNLICLDVVLIFEELLCGCVVIVVFLLIYNMCVWMIDIWGNEEQCQCFLLGMMMMDKIVFYCLIELGVGFDVVSLCIKVKCDGDYYVFNGFKVFIFGVGMFDYYVVMCCIGDDGFKGVFIVVVEKDMFGFSFGVNEKKMGWNVQLICVVMFEDCCVLVVNCLVDEGMGFILVMNGFNGGCINIGVCLLGGVIEVFEIVKEYVYMCK